MRFRKEYMQKNPTKPGQITWKRLGDVIELPDVPCTHQGLLSKLRGNKVIVPSIQCFTMGDPHALDLSSGGICDVIIVETLVTGRAFAFDNRFVMLAQEQGLFLLPHAAGPLLRLHQRHFEWSPITVATQPIGRSIEGNILYRHRGRPEFLLRLNQLNSKEREPMLVTVDSGIRISDRQYWAFGVIA